VDDAQDIGAELRAHPPAEDAANPRPPPGPSSRSQIRTVFLGIGSRGALMAINMLVLMVTSRLIAPPEFGAYAIAQLCVDLAAAFAYPLVGVPMLQARRFDRDDRAIAFTLLLLLGVVAGGLLALSAPTLETALGLPLLAHLLTGTAVIVPLRFVATYFIASLQRQSRVEQVIWAQTRSQIVSSLGVTLLGAVLGFHVWALLAGLGTATLLELYWTARAASDRPGLRLGRRAWAFLGQGLGPLAHGAVVFTADAVDKIAIGRGFGAFALGVYTRAANLVLIPQGLLGIPAQSTLFAWFSRYKSEPPRVSAALTKALEIQGLLLLPATVCAGLASPILILVLLGNQWTGAVPVAQALFVGAFARLGSIPSDVAALTLGHGWNSARRQFATILVLCAGLAISFGHSVVWAAAAVSASRLLGYLLGLRFAARTFHVPWRAIVVGHARGAALAAFGLAAVWAVQALVSTELPLLADLVRVSAFSLAVALALALGPDVLAAPAGLSATRRHRMGIPHLATALRRLRA